MDYTLNLLAVSLNVSYNAVSLFLTNVSSLPSSFSHAHYFEVQQGLFLWLSTTKEEWCRGVERISPLQSHRRPALIQQLALAVMGTAFGAIQ